MSSFRILSENIGTGRNVEHHQELTRSIVATASFQTWQGGIQDSDKNRGYRDASSGPSRISDQSNDWAHSYIDWPSMPKIVQDSKPWASYATPPPPKPGRRICKVPWRVAFLVLAAPRPPSKEAAQALAETMKHTVFDKKRTAHGKRCHFSPLKLPVGLPDSRFQRPLA